VRLDSALLWLRLLTLNKAIEFDKLLVGYFATNREKVSVKKVSVILYNAYDPVNSSNLEPHADIG